MRTTAVSVIALAVIVFTAPCALASAYQLEQELHASDATMNDGFGFASAMSADGSRVVVGAWNATVGANAVQGEAYVYVRSGSSWTLEQKLVAPDGAANDYYGWAVAITSDGARVAIGKASVGSPGAVYVYTRSGATWALEQKLTASDAASNDYFGISVSLAADGTRIGVGASNATISGHGAQGATYVFSRSGATWTQEQKITAADGATNHTFGYVVSTTSNCDRMVISSPGYNSYQGAAYVYSRSGTVWSLEQEVTSSDGVAGDAFAYGVSIAADGSRFISGAYNTNSTRGAVYVYSRSGVTWSQEQKLAASDGVAGDYLGITVALSPDGSMIVGGAYGFNSYRGAAYVFTRSGTSWTEIQKLTAPDGLANDFFGWSMATGITSDNSRFTVGVYGGSNSIPGALYVYNLPAVPAVGGSACTGSVTVGISITGGAASPTDVHLLLDGAGMDSNAMYTTYCGTHTISASELTGYTKTWSGDCDSTGMVSIDRDVQRTCTAVYAYASPTPSSTPTPNPSVSPAPTPSPSLGGSLSAAGLHEGDTVSAAGSSDPDVYIVNIFGYKRLFLNPVIFSFYGHLGGFANVKTITAPVRDSFPTSGLFRNCETNDPKVYGVQTTGEDTGILHHINITGDEAVAQDPEFFKKVFCINTNEFNWYTKGSDYTSLSQVPVYSR